MTHRRWARRVRSREAAPNQYIQAIDDGVERVARVESHMEQILTEWERKPHVDALMAFRGFKTVAAMTIVSELGDLSRFAKPSQLMGYLGMVSSESSSGEKRRQGAIWLGRSARGLGLRPASGCLCRLRPSAPFQDRQRPRPLDAHRVWFALQPCPARLTAAFRAAERPEQGSAIHRLAGPEPAQRPLPSPGRAGPASQQDHRGHRPGTVRFSLGATPSGLPGDRGGKSGRRAAPEATREKASIVPTGGQSSTR